MIRIFFGSPGAGKTTLAVRQLYKMKRRRRQPYDYYYSNFSNALCASVDLTGLGTWTFPEHSYIVIDEAGIEFNNRNYKSFPKELISWMKLHRHFKCDVDFISQSWEDTDITIRRLADELWYIKRFGPFTIVRRVYKFVTINEETSQIQDGYRFAKIIKKFLPPPFRENSFYLVFRPRFYRYFDSYSRPSVPVRYSDLGRRDFKKKLARREPDFNRRSCSGMGRGDPSKKNLFQRIKLLFIGIRRRRKKT